MTSSSPDAAKGPSLPAAVRAPVFPLSDVWLFPRAILPLHVFEPRYRQMVEDSLDGPGRLVLATIVAGHEGEHLGAPPVYPVAGLGEIGRHDRLPDGRFHVVLVGLARVRITEVPSAKPYRIVDADPLPECRASRRDEAALRPALVTALRSGDAQDAEWDEIPLGVLADALLVRTRLPHARFNALFMELDVACRARGVLAERDGSGPAG